MANALSRIPAILCVAVSLIIALPLVATADDELQPSPIRRLIIGYIKGHPQSTFAEVAAFANARLPENGVNYQLAIYDRVPPHRTVEFSAGAHRLLARTPDRVEIGPCGEFWVTVPALRAGPDSIDLVFRGQRLTAPWPAGLEGETMTVYSTDQKTVLSRIHVPWADFPRGVLPDGSAVIVDFLLGNEANDWWQRVRAAGALSALPNYGHLLLRVGGDGLKFIEDPSPYGSESGESITDFPNPTHDSFRHRDRFPNSGLVVEYESACT